MIIGLNISVGFVIGLFLTVLRNASCWVPLPTMDEWKTWPLEELEKQMSPSNWNPGNLTSEQVIEKYVDSGLRGTNQARSTIAHSLDVPYGPKPREKVDFYGTDLPMDSPVFFWIHGGYWQEGSKDIAGNFANVLYSLGFKTAVMGYTLAPEARIEDIMDELVDALRLVVSRYSSSKLVIGGHSAGGQLAASLLTRELFSILPALKEQVMGMYFVSGVYDLRPVVPTSSNIALKLTPKNAQNLSALFNDVHPSWLTVPLKNQIIVANYDSPEFQRQSTGYYEQLKSLFDTTFWVSEFDDHFSIVEELSNPKSETCKKLMTYLQQFKNVGKGSSGSAVTLVNISLSALTILASIFLLL